MATEFPITRPSVDEAPTPLEVSFFRLLKALAQHIWAEQDMDRADLSNPTCDRVLDAAENARMALYEVLAKITALQATSAADVPLRRMALIIATLVREGTGTAFARYREHQTEFAAFLDVAGNGRAEMSVRKMIAAADKRIRLMAHLTLYRQDGIVHEAEAELVAA